MKRRTALQTMAGIGLAGWLGPIGSFSWRGDLAAADADVTPEMVRLGADIEPLVRLIETTPREKCVEMAAQQLREGTSYRQLLAALYLAGIRNVNPQPPGFKFHCVFVIHAAHQLSLSAPVGDRLLPLLWSLDDFKKSQEQDVQQGDFRLPVAPANLPSPGQAWREFHAAMEEWNQERADRAIVALVRSRGAIDIVEGLWRYGARDYRNIGHKAIFVANTWRTLQTIGWRHAEPALRSLVLGLLDFGRDKQVNDFAYEDQTYLPNLELVRKFIGQFPQNWTTVKPDTEVTRAMLDAFRSAGPRESCQAAVEDLRRGLVTATAVWDAAHLLAGELMMRQPGIYGIHTVTSLNGLRYAYETAADPETRLLMLLQGVGWMGQFQRFMAGKNDGLRPVRITDLPAEPPAPAAAADRVFELIGKDAPQAALQAMTLAHDAAATELFKRTAYRLIFRKATDAHDYKYAAAIFEDLDMVSPVWRPHMLATATYHLRSANQPDSPLMLRAAEALRT